MTKKIKENTFEEALLELETLLNDVENSNLSLEELVDSFEKGTELSNYCLSKLEEAKIRISTIEKDKN